MTRVLNLDTGKAQHFSISPHQAVIAAFEQSKGNWNTWTYPTPGTKSQLGPSGRTVSCGSFCAMLHDRQSDTHCGNDNDSP